MRNNRYRRSVFRVTVSAVLIFLAGLACLLLLLIGCDPSRLVPPAPITPITLTPTWTSTWTPTLPPPTHIPTRTLTPRSPTPTFTTTSSATSAPNTPTETASPSSTPTDAPTLTATPIPTIKTGRPPILPTTGAASNNFAFTTIAGVLLLFLSAWAIDLAEQHT